MSRDPLNPFDDTVSNRTSQPSHSSLDDVKERVSDVAAKTKDKAGQVVDAVSDKLNQQRESAADGLGRAASTLHENASRLPGGPKIVNFTHSIADGMESTATYLRENGLSKMGDELMAVCRRYPTQSLVAAIALGFLVGRSGRR